MPNVQLTPASTGQSITINDMNPYFIPVIDVTIARGSRTGHRPASTCTMKSPTSRLN
jgi:hypothetical protein